MNKLRTKAYWLALPILLISQFFTKQVTAQVGTGYFNGTVFSTYASVNTGAISGISFSLTYTGTFATRQLANFNPGSLPANTGFPTAAPRSLELMANAANASARYSFNANLPRFTTLFVEDVDVNESIRIEFLDAGSTPINVSNILFKYISTAVLPTITNAATSITLSSTATNVTEALMAFIINTTTVRSIRITQLSGNTGGTYIAYFGTPGLDYGDAPATYGDAGHLPATNLRLGALGPDAEASSNSSTPANGDDAATSSSIIDDEDGVAAFGTLYTNATSYSVNVAVSNTTGANATLYGWIDFDQDGTFDAGEASAATTVPNGATTATVNWTGLSGLTTGTNYARFRIASVAGEASVSTGLAANGETEDYRLVNIILPLTLVNFSGQRNGDNILAHWRTEQEVNVSHFELEYSTDGVTYKSGGSIPAKNGVVNEYEFTLQNFLQPLYYIRLKCIDIDKRTKYSSGIIIKKSGTYTKTLQVTPNPVRDRAVIHIISDVATTGNIRVYDMVGHSIYNASHSLQRGDNTIYINQLSNAVQGTYVVQAIIDRETLVQKIIISK